MIDGDPWTLRYIDDLTRDQVKKFIRKIGDDDGFKVAANRTLTAMQGMFKWAAEEGIIAVNPIADLAPFYPEKSRARWLSDTEIRAFWWACDQIGYPYGRIYQLLFLIAARRKEVAAIPLKGELDKSQRLWTLPAERTKTIRRTLCI
jgi:site-specific recombinase XerD